ncbi:hypothetical protein CAG99_06950 [Streptomyces marincola]|uniref:Aminoglycoside phosphotransferase domain-containing protein n=1 Tax=Streptomyces marincola TaxID=2878388 RepID=A0A1W7CV16_9ACTN|nr:hypothetical protein CAG99_06950 [Streptomyces marincola]
MTSASPTPAPSVSPSSAPSTAPAAPAGSAPGTREISAVLAERWHLPGAVVTELPGGMNSLTWHVGHRGAHWVAKAVPEGGPERPFRYGLRLAALAEAAGVPSGVPERAADGRLTARARGHVLALLRWVPGRELNGADPGDLARLGATLARAHLALGTGTVSGDRARASFDPAAGGREAAYAVRPWIRPALAGAAARLRRVRPETLTWGPSHGDPAPEHFRFDARTGRCGLIDWGAAGHRPRLYDLATAVLDAGGPDGAGPLLRAYVEGGGLPSEEIERGLLPVLDFRYAVNTLYYADRVARGVTGPEGPGGNEERLDDARRWFERRAGGRAG